MSEGHMETELNKEDAEQQRIEISERIQNSFISRMGIFLDADLDEFREWLRVRCDGLSVQTVRKLLEVSNDAGSSGNSYHVWVEYNDRKVKLVSGCVAGCGTMCLIFLVSVISAAFSLDNPAGPYMGRLMLASGALVWSGYAMYGWYLGRKAMRQLHDMAQQSSGDEMHE